MIGKSVSWATYYALFFFLSSSCKSPFDLAFKSQVSVINIGDSTIRFSLINPKRKVKPNSKSEYFWFRSGKIHRTEGEYGGKLLDGQFDLFGPDSDLFQKGQFKNGKKKGIWKFWYPDGDLAEVVKFRRGKVSGKVDSFDQNGKLKLSSRYANGKKSGMEKEFKGGEKRATRRFKNGDLIWEKMNAF